VILLTHDGKTQSAKAWAREYGINYMTLRGRLRTMSLARALHATEGDLRAQSARRYTHDGYTGTVDDWAKRLGLHAETVRSRLRKMPAHLALSPRTERGSIRLKTRGRELWPGANTTRFEEDAYARAMLRVHGRLTHAAIGKILGVPKQNVQLIEARALAKLRMSNDLPMLAECVGIRQGARA
jgi:DNA-directed RNA polymerase sigma subunit (sigma70/sigma32)